MGERYFLKADWSSWSEVSKETWVRAERIAGFRNSTDLDGEPATGGFSGNGTKGRIIGDSSVPANYDWDPDFAVAAWPVTS